MEMEKLKHFSHEHPLELIDRESVEIDRNSICYGCQRPINLSVSEPAYSCYECSFFLHKKCAELPEDISHPMHPQHSLVLQKSPEEILDSWHPRRRLVDCSVCGKRCWGNFTYHCNTCEFNLDIVCATTEVRQLEKHPSHVHALTFKMQWARFWCHACGGIEEDTSSYSCTSCPYWIHGRCASLPTEKKRWDHDHPLSLAYCLSDDHSGYGFSCDVCHKDIFECLWNYYCGPCRHFVHIHCIEKRKYESLDLFVGGDELELPTDDFAGDLQQNLRNCSELLPPPDSFDVIWRPGQDLIRISNPEIQMDGDSVVRFALQRDTGKVSSDQEMTCEACCRPIISECYKRADSNYFLHVTCALENLTTVRDAGFDLVPVYLKQRLPASTWGFLKCDACNLDCNGYSFNDNPRTTQLRNVRCYFEKSNFCLDVNCAMLPSKIAHAADRHWLSRRWLLWNRPPFTPRDNPCNGCGDSACNRDFYFFCGSCDFSLGYHCALLPKTVKHRWDKHPLILSFPPYPGQPGKFYCEVCEEEIHPWRWQYRCRECDQSFHPRCIPQVSSSRNIKFGITVDVGEHPHTLKLVPEGEYHPGCGSCGESLYRRRAFKCAENCKFYLCHDCVVKIKSKGSADTQ